MDSRRWVQVWSRSRRCGAGGADSAGVIYTGTAVTTKSMRILGHVTWEANALATAGLYSSAPDTVHLMSPGSHRSGDIIGEWLLGRTSNT